MSITRKEIPRKGKDAEGRAACGRPAPPRRSGGFTAEELAELARADAEIDDAPDFLTPEERALSQALDQQAAEEHRPPAARDLSRKRAAKARETPEHRAARLAKEKAWRDANREKLRALSAAYNASHRQERRDYQKAYDAAHREEINAKNRARYAARKRKEGNNGRKI